MRSVVIIDNDSNKIYLSKPMPTEHILKSKVGGQSDLKVDTYRQWALSTEVSQQNLRDTPRSINSVWEWT